MKDRFITFFSLIGIVLTLSEFILKFFNSSLCSTEGCILISKSIRYSDNIIVAGGLVVFSLIFIFNLSGIKRAQFLINQLLIISLSAEGVFVGYQLFRMKHICLFCMSIFSIFVVISVYRIVKKEVSVASGFISFFAIIFLFYMLKPVEATTPVATKPLVLIYKKSCEHCERVIKEAKKNKINICMIKAKSCLGLLRSLNIKEVPILIVNKKGEKKMIIGEHKILQYFLSKKGIPKSNLYNTLFKDEKGFCKIGEKCQ